MMASRISGGRLIRTLLLPLNAVMVGCSCRILARCVKGLRVHLRFLPVDSLKIHIQCNQGRMIDWLQCDIE